MISRRKIVKRWLLLLVCLVVTLAAGGNVKAESTCKSGISYPGRTNAEVNLRKKAGQNYQSYGMIRKGQNITILGYVTNKGSKWYKCKAKVNGKNRIGYVKGSYVEKAVKTAGRVNKKVDSYLNVRKSARVTARSLLKIPKDTKVNILGIKKSAGKYWYKVKASNGSKTRTGYVYSTYITVDKSADSGAETEPSKTGEDEETTEAPVEKQTKLETSYDDLLKAFPEDYRKALNELHKKYPDWKFVAITTGLEWSDVIANEDVAGKNVIQSNYPNGGDSLAPFSYLSTASGAYNWVTDQYTVKDGSNWYCVDSQVLAYYLDPRNFLNDNDIFQFEALDYDDSQNEKVVQSILGNTFMKDKYSVEDSATGKKVSGSYTQAFMDAGKTANVNPYFLASRCKQEVGVKGSAATSGTCDGYKGLYNFYNIGATDGAGAVQRGLLWASGGAEKLTTYNRPWTNPHKAIVGGAQYIAMNYINVGQNTLYFQKFNVSPVNEKLRYQHQYMTNVEAPFSEGRITREAYNSLGIMGSAMIFYIPVYNNMPSQPSALPEKAGNPNPYLSSLKIYDGETELQLSPVFSYNHKSYTLTVPKSVKEVTVKAKTASSRAAASGAGTVSLEGSGETSVTVTVKAENGTKKKYIIQIKRSGS